VFTLKTFKADGTLIASANGFFVGENGEALSSFTPFKDARRAVVIDAQGKEWPVDCLMGVNDMYDVAKFQVEAKKTVALPLADSTATGSTVWLLPYSVKKAPACQQGTVASAEKFQGNYSYYTLDLQATDQHSGCPIMNDQGEALGLLQPAAKSDATQSFAISAPFVNSLTINGLSLNDPVLRNIPIAKALPDKADEALLALYISSSALDSVQHREYVERFIRKFPQNADGYIYRARNAFDHNDFAAADADMQQALKVSDKPDDTHYQYAQMILQKEIYRSDTPYSPWTLDRALEESQQATKANPQPLYRLQQAQILYAQQKYDEAFLAYEELSQTPLRSADNFYAAAQCKLQQDDKKGALAQLDSAVSTYTKPYLKTASPYLHARAQLLMDLRRYQLALNDMRDVVALEPNNEELWAEKGSYELRVNQADMALESGSECLRINAESSDGYLITGIALCMKDQKAEGLQNLRKAKELGNGQAQKFIDKYAN
jgi:tetratricopeptide (TPR) repeat protein